MRARGIGGVGGAGGGGEGVGSGWPQQTFLWQRLGPGRFSWSWHAPSRVLSIQPEAGHIASGPSHWLSLAAPALSVPSPVMLLQSAACFAASAAELILNKHQHSYLKDITKRTEQLEILNLQSFQVYSKGCWTANPAACSCPMHLVIPQVMVRIYMSDTENDKV